MLHGAFGMRHEGRVWHPMPEGLQHSKLLPAEDSIIKVKCSNSPTGFKPKDCFFACQLYISIVTCA